MLLPGMTAQAFWASATMSTMTVWLWRPLAGPPPIRRGGSPLLLPAELDYHRVDERVPGSALRFGVEVLDTLFDLI